MSINDKLEELKKRAFWYCRKCGELYNDSQEGCCTTIKDKGTWVVPLFVIYDVFQNEFRGKE